MNEYGINKTRLRGVYDPSVLSKHHKINIMENKLPLTLDLGKKNDIDGEHPIKFCYKCAEELLDDFNNYLHSFKSLKMKTSEQYMKRC